MELVFLCIKIFCCRIIDVSMGTIRTINVVKGKTLIGAVIGFFEVLIWFLIVKDALNTELTGILNSLFIAISYAGGYATGTYIGGMLSDKFIQGNLTLQVILTKNDDELVDAIRKEGDGVSVLDVRGQLNINDKYMLFIEIDKKNLSHVTSIIKKLDKKAFIVVNETKLVQNGFIK